MKIKDRTIKAAIREAGCLFDDSGGTIAERLMACANYKNPGSDGDYTEQERDLFCRASKKKIA